MFRSSVRVLDTVISAVTPPHCSVTLKLAVSTIKGYGCGKTNYRTLPTHLYAAED